MIVVMIYAVFKIWQFFIAHISFVIDCKELTNEHTVQDVNKDSPKSGALSGRGHLQAAPKRFLPLLAPLLSGHQALVTLPLLASF